MEKEVSIGKDPGNLEILLGQGMSGRLLDSCWADKAAETKMARNVTRDGTVNIVPSVKISTTVAGTERLLQWDFAFSFTPRVLVYATHEPGKRANPLN